MTAVHPVEEWIALNKQGVSYSEIAERYGVTRGIVAGAKWRFENPGKDADYYRSFRAVRQQVGSERKWTDEINHRRQYKHFCDIFPAGTMRRHVLEAFLAGQTCAEIGAALGMTPQGARYHLTAMGIGNIPTLQAKTRPSQKAAA